MSTHHDSSIYDTISNDEIRRRLISEHQFNCGPVTPSTRRVLLRKLVQLEKEKSQNDSSTLNTNAERSVIDDSLQDADSSVVENGDGAHSNGQMEMSEVVSDISVDVGRLPPRQSSRRYSPRRKTDEMGEAIKSFSEVKKMKIKQSVGSDFSRTSRSQRHGVVQNIVVSEQRGANLNDFSSEGSDSDDNENVPTTRPTTENTPSSFKISRIAIPRIFSNGGQSQTSNTTLSRAPIQRTTPGKPASSLLNYSDSESDVEEVKKDKICKLLLSHRPGLGRSKAQKASIKSRISSFFSYLKEKLTFSSPNSSTDFSKSSNYISYILLTLVILFFTSIFSVYFYAKFTFVSKQALDLKDYTFIEDKSKLVAPICPNNSSLIACLPHESDRKPALNLIKEIKARIDKTIYENYCDSTLNRRRLRLSDFTFSKSELYNYAKNYNAAEEREGKLLDMSPYTRFENDYANALKLIELNPAWNMKCSDPLVGDILLTPDYSLNLPMQCRLNMIIYDYFWIILATLFTVVLSTIVLFYYRYTKRKEIREQEQVFELIEKSMELLQSPDEPQSMPVLHIRDTLLSPSERKSAHYKRVWNKVVNHIENGESRVKVEFKKIDGEDFKAWKWIANTGSQFLDSSVLDNETDSESVPSLGLQTQKIGGVEWQGQAFAHLPKGASSRVEEKEVNPSITPETYRNKNFQALTRFLKIRNMFEKEAQYIDPNWSKKIKNTILEKTASTSENGSHDIVHIEIEDNPQEGLVYLKCGSIRGATNAFHAMHGWWCEKKLVSVKFLKEERYYQRFPEARHMNTPLPAQQVR